MPKLFLPLLLVATATSFSPQIKTIHRLAPLNVGATLDLDDEASWMGQAQSCASSDSCSLEENKVCLENVIRIQSACSAGSLIGDRACDDVISAVEIVANLRSKIDKQSQVLRTIIAGTMVANASFLACLFAAMATAGLFVDPNAAPFTPQEVWWSIRDGYLPLLLKEYYQNGGLAGATPESTSFTMQEMWWALKGGYLDTLLSQFFHNGGLSSIDDAVASASPFTPQEWSSTMQGGYMPQILSQTFVHGGLTDVDTDTLTITPQEWIWAAQGNYLGDLMKSFIEHGGI